jgi:hypothetical protein
VNEPTLRCVTWPSPSVSTIEIIISISSSVIISPMQTRMWRISEAPTKLLWSRSMNLNAAVISSSVNSGGSLSWAERSCCSPASLAASSAGISSSGIVLITGFVRSSSPSESSRCGAGILRSVSSKLSTSGRNCGYAMATGPEKPNRTNTSPISLIPPLAFFCFSDIQLSMFPLRNTFSKDTCTAPSGMSLPPVLDWFSTSSSIRYWSTTSNSISLSHTGSEPPSLSAGVRLIIFTALPSSASDT